MRLAILNWRDLTHPEGGGAERYAQTMAAGLASRGHDITFFCAAHSGAPRVDLVDGYRIVRQGSRATVYYQALRALRRASRENGAFDAVVDVQNGVPFWSVVALDMPIVCLVHHVHREQWPVVFGPFLSRLGWILESQVTPRLYRGRPYVTVSGRSRDELVQLGVRAEHIQVIHNGTDRPMALAVERSPVPTIVVLGRLVPHKRVELAVDVLARLRDTHVGLQLRIVGDGWWRERIEAHAARLGVTRDVHFLGYVDEVTKHHELSRAWVALAPSAKEGWGLNVVEAASHGVPTIAHHDAGGLSESIVDQRTGLLVHDLSGMVDATSRLLSDPELRNRLGHEARDRASRYSWDTAVDEWEALLARIARQPRYQPGDLNPVDPGVVEEGA